MRFAHIAIALSILALPQAVQARGWKSLTPGQSKQSDVLQKFGEPTSQGKVGAKNAIVYKGEQAIEGTRAVQIYLRGDGIVDEITVFPASEVDKDAMEGTYGKPE